MEFLHGLYCRKVHYLQNIDDRQPVHGIGDMTTYSLLRRFQTISTVMLIAVSEEKVTATQIENRKVIPLLEAIDQRPKSLEKSMLSWVQFPGEEKPSVIFIHNGPIDDLFQNMVYTQLVSETSLSELGYSVTYDKMREKANKAVLSTPIKVE
jgi:hypothetical protein